MITTVTLTGADDSILPEQLLEISKQFPFVEWGILVSRRQQGNARFPSIRWIKELLRLNEANRLAGKGVMNLSMHLCGSFVHEILANDSGFIDAELEEIWPAFQRVQINTHGQQHFVSSDFTETLNYFSGKEWIFQYDNVNTLMLDLAIKNKVKCSALFDLSHGAGILPESWPALLPNVKCGYAGGLSPENLQGQLFSINQVVTEEAIWIDMETHLRSFNDRVFDLLKCRAVLNIALNHVKQHQINL